ncbi:uncharacterized protein METZ01_LOCUS435292, partial [marine metagenome]
ILKSPPRRLGMMDCPVPTTPALANRVYPRIRDLLAAAGAMLELDVEDIMPDPCETTLDVPDPTFTGPF